MRRLITLSLSICFLSACESHAPDLREKCRELLQDPAMQEFYEPAHLRQLSVSLDSCGADQQCLQGSYDLILDKLATAKTEIAIRKTAM